MIRSTSQFSYKHYKDPVQIGEMEPLVAIVVLNWNKPAETICCLESLQQLTYPKYIIILVDNCSTDDSVDVIKARFPEVLLICSPANLGYAGGNNLGIHKALEQGADWVLLLNNDTVTAPDFLNQLLVSAGRDDSAGILGPTVYFSDQPALIQSAGGSCNSRFEPYHILRNELDGNRPQKPVQVDWISGCAILARSEMIRQIGVLDERFFAYEEELEWCIRARKCGWKIFHVPPAKIWHSGLLTESQPRPYITYYMTRNHLLLLSKVGAGFFVRASFVMEKCRTLLSWSLRPKWRSMKQHRDALWKALVDYYSRRWGEMSQ